jgi:hypothetical protein
MNEELTPPPVKGTNVPANEYERFLASLPDALREECRARLTGSGFSPDHPVFQVLADFFEKSPTTAEPIRDFIGEANLHADRSKQLLDELQNVPQAILAQIETQLTGFLSALNGPVEKLDLTATHLQRNVEALPVLLLGKRSSPPPDLSGKWNRFKWSVTEFCRTGRTTLFDLSAWIVSGSISLTLAFALAGVLLVCGASHLSHSYEEAYQKRLTRLEADSVQNTVALNRLLAAGITLKVERSKDDDAYFLVLLGARKAAQPVPSPEGLAVEVWP